MDIGRVKAAKISDITIDADIDMNSYDLTEVGNITLGTNSGVQLLAALAASGDWCGETVLATAGEDIKQFDTVYLTAADGVHKANATNDTEVPVKGIATADVDDGNEGVFLIEGFIRNNDWGWAVGALLYAGTVDGGLRVSAPPASGNMVQRVGIAIHEDIIWFRPDLTMVEVA